MKAALLALLCVFSVAASAAMAPACDEDTFEGQTSCKAGAELVVMAPPPVPEPGTFGMLAAGIAAIVYFKARRRSK